MTFVRPEYPRSDVRRAGETLVQDNPGLGDLVHATVVMTNWRAAHGYLMNTFQATLRHKLEQIDSDAIVGQRLKRAPSIIAKLKRFNTMKLHQMQDIAGLRAIVTTMPKLRRLHENYRSSRFTHELVKTNDYVTEPKTDGYRSIHLVYKYKNTRVPEYDNLHVELQLRTKIQHAWATAVETVDAFLGEAIKAGRPGEDWAQFFKLASASFSHGEKSPSLAEFENVPLPKLIEMLKESENRLGVRMRLSGFRVAADQINKSGRSSASYHLVVLNTGSRTLTIKSFPFAEQEAANKAYADCEKRAADGEPIDPVLVAGGTVDSLRKSYPNYFLDTDVFLRRLDRLIDHGV